MIPRIMSRKFKSLVGKYPVVTLTGPRQSGKTTLVRALFPGYRYVSFEDPDVRLYASEDPRGFLEQYAARMIFDEAQRVPEIFSYLQTHTDRQQQNGQFILTGSQHFLLSEGISQSLAGRTGILYLMPLSIEEIKRVSKVPVERFLIQGGYPRLHKEAIAPGDFFPGYIATYVERDIRLIKNIVDLASFERFLRLCAGRVGQLLNFSALADDVGVSHNTVKSWLNLLEASFIVFRLQPHHRNFKKRLVKMPKLYFWDSGLLCSLLGIENERQLSSHFLLGHIFENAVIAELLKYRYNRGKRHNCYFWRDRHGREIDCIIEKTSAELIPVEIKSGKTVSPDYFKGIRYWQKLSGCPHGYVVYAGQTAQQRTFATVLPWHGCLGVFQ